ncbi:hypothetical protein BT63DRAFT_453364 [Microthyrium microscopicum]|uniref:Uncharacterized protein n=1 Tax=Microthyrium microscopicum TaxID=703497 RepID=A0A6A6UFM8_9PEZI|nr:hypothetical protein BT63DRAFT_453364 [Microthyrium microscopicum]
MPGRHWSVSAYDTRDLKAAQNEFLAGVRSALEPQAPRAPPTKIAPLQRRVLQNLLEPSVEASSFTQSPGFSLPTKPLAVDDPDISHSKTHNSNDDSSTLSEVSSTLEEDCDTSEEDCDTVDEESDTSKDQSNYSDEDHKPSDETSDTLADASDYSPESPPIQTWTTLADLSYHGSTR